MKDLKPIGKILGVYLVLFSIFIIHKKIQAPKELLLIDGDASEVSNQVLELAEDVSPVDKIYIHISGEVYYPGLVELDEGTRLYELVDMAGGLTERADVDKINLAATLCDEERIHIPAIGEEDNSIGFSSSPKVNINTATKEELMSLPGVGEKTATSIIDYRSSNRFNKIEDIMNVPGIGEKKFEDLKPHISK